MYTYKLQPMSITQQRIISQLLFAAGQSNMRCSKHAAAVCAGGKILSMNVNTDRSKYGNEIRCSGHSEIACIHGLFPGYFNNKVKKYYVQR